MKSARDSHFRADRHTKNALPAGGAFFILVSVEVLAKSMLFAAIFGKIASNPLRWAQRSSLDKLDRITLARVDATRRVAHCVASLLAESLLVLSAFSESRVFFEKNLTLSFCGCILGVCVFCRGKE